MQHLVFFNIDISGSLELLTLTCIFPFCNLLYVAEFLYLFYTYYIIQVCASIILTTMWLQLHELQQ